MIWVEAVLVFLAIMTVFGKKISEKTVGYIIRKKGNDEKEKNGS